VIMENKKGLVMVKMLQIVAKIKNMEIVDGN
jgi:hypothetical protein